jgi:hypothetical protein
MGISIAEALDRIRAAGVILRVDGTSLKASGVPLNPSQRSWLRANKLRVISEIECPSRCDCGQPAWVYDERDARLEALCEGHAAERGFTAASFWPENAA